MDEADLEEVLDDWFIESLKTYKDLHVYHLEHSTQVLEWTSGRTVCVAGYSSSSKNEILELSLPLRLLTEQNKGLCAQRDFKVVHGGFSDAPIVVLKHIPGTRCAVSNDGVSSTLLLWDLGGEDSDVIRQSGCIEPTVSSGLGGRRISAPVSQTEPKILHGTNTDDVLLTNISTGQHLYKLDCASSEPLSSLHFISDAAFVGGSINGSILLADTRSSSAPQIYPPVCPSSAPFCPTSAPIWWLDASPSRVVRLSSLGHVIVSDLKQIEASVAQAQIQKSQGSLKAAVSWAPALDHHIAVSGLSGLVQIYDTSLWGVELQFAQPQFEHRGHMVCSSDADVITTCHTWHPERPTTLLTAANDGSLHVWDWNKQSEL